MVGQVGYAGSDVRGAALLSLCAGLDAQNDRMSLRMSEGSGLCLSFTQLCNTYEYMRNGRRRRRLPRIDHRRFRKTVPWLSMCSSERPLVSPSAHAPNPTAQPASTPVHRISSVALSDSVQRIQR